MAKNQRRTRGAGSLYQRADGTWVATQELPPDPRTGKRRRLTAKGKSRSAAAARLKTKVEGARLDGELTIQQLPTLAEWMDHWLESRKYRLRPATAACYRMAINHISQFIGETRLDRITPQLLEKWQVMEEAQYAHKTVLTDRGVVGGALKQAVKNGLLTKNPLEATEPPVGSTKPREAPTPAEAAAIIAAEDRPVWRLQWCLAFLGMRQGERQGVTRGELEVRDGVPGIRIAHQVRKGKPEDWPANDRPYTKPVPGHPGFVYAPAKTKAGQRWVPLLGTALAAWREVAEANPGGDDDLVCLSSTGLPLTGTRERKAWIRVLDRAGIGRWLVPHSARHTADSILAMLGVPDATRIGILGHSSTAMDAVYVHAQTEAVVAAAQALAGELEGTEAGA